MSGSSLITEGDLIAAFWARVERGPEHWRWIGYIHPDTGYGSFSFRGRGYRAHRLSLLIHGIFIPPGYDVCHDCDLRWCVNPSHLYPGTRRQNMEDCTARGRHNKPSGETHWCAKLTASDILNIREKRSQGVGIQALACQFSVNHGTISRVARGVWRKEVI